LIDNGSPKFDAQAQCDELVKLINEQWITASTSTRVTKDAYHLFSGTRTTVVVRLSTSPGLILGFVPDTEVGEGEDVHKKPELLNQNVLFGRFHLVTPSLYLCISFNLLRPLFVFVRIQSSNLPFWEEPKVRQVDHQAPSQPLDGATGHLRRTPRLSFIFCYFALLCSIPARLITRSLMHCLPPAHD
jgi:hypothetical protein